MTSNTLDYASPPRPKPTYRPSSSRIFAAAAVLAILCTLAERAGGGSDGFHLRDERLYGCLISVGCVVACAVTRAWSARPLRVVRATVFTAAVIASSVAFFAAHIVSLRGPVPAISYRSAYWCYLAAFTIAPVVVSVYVGLVTVIGRRRRRRPAAHRPAG